MRCCLLKKRIKQQHGIVTKTTRHQQQKRKSGTRYTLIKIIILKIISLLLIVPNDFTAARCQQGRRWETYLPEPVYRTTCPFVQIRASVHGSTPQLRKGCLKEQTKTSLLCKHHLPLPLLSPSYNLKQGTVKSLNSFRTLVGVYLNAPIPVESVRGKVTLKSLSKTRDPSCTFDCTYGKVSKCLTNPTLKFPTRLETGNVPQHAKSKPWTEQ